MTSEKQTNKQQSSGTDIWVTGVRILLCAFTPSCCGLSRSAKRSCHSGTRRLSPQQKEGAEFIARRNPEPPETHHEPDTHPEAQKSKAYLEPHRQREFTFGRLPEGQLGDGELQLSSSFEHPYRLRVIGKNGDGGATILPACTWRRRHLSGSLSYVNTGSRPVIYISTPCRVIRRFHAQNAQPVVTRVGSAPGEGEALPDGRHLITTTDFPLCMGIRRAIPSTKLTQVRAISCAAKQLSNERRRT